MFQQSLLKSSLVFSQLSLFMMTSAQVVKVNITTNSLSLGYSQMDMFTPPSYDKTPGFKQFTIYKYIQIV